MTSRQILEHLRGVGLLKDALTVEDIAADLPVSEMSHAELADLVLQLEKPGIAIDWIEPSKQAGRRDRDNPGVR